MKNTYFTVGPSQLFPTVNDHLREAIEHQIGSISHRSKQFEDIFSSVVTNLKALLSIPENYAVFFVSSGTEAMERTIENVVEKTSFHFVNGAFSKRFYETAVELGKKPQKIEAELGEGFSLIPSPSLRATPPWEGNTFPSLGRDGDSQGRVSIPKSTELICLTHNETATGVMLPGQDIANIKKAYPDKLVAIDMVSSAPYGRIDFTYADIVFFSVQKLFGLPAGLGVMIVSPQALGKSNYLAHKYSNHSPLLVGEGKGEVFSSGTIGTYHSFPTLKKWADKNQTPETPSVLHFYLLNKVLEDMVNIGIKAICKQTDEKADLLYDFFDAHKTWSSFVENKPFRSPTVIVANVGEDQKELLEHLKSHGIIVGKGYGANKDTQIRIANFPALSIEDIKKLLKLLKQF